MTFVSDEMENLIEKQKARIKELEAEVARLKKPNAIRNYPDGYDWINKK
jgi:cell division protein FtsB